MITPAFGLTATERVLPKLALDFTTAFLDSRITFTRTTGASNPATYVNSSGVITEAVNNQPRFDYDPVTLACKGLLIEESRINAIRNSNAVAVGTGWTTQQVGTATIATTSNYSVAPDGTTTATRVIFNNNGGTGTGNYALFNQSLTGRTVGVSYADSIWLKTNDNSTVTLLFRDDTGARFNTLITVTGTWTRFSLAGATTNASTQACKIWIRTGVGTSTFADISAWGGQSETGAFATSYIPTTSAALTRNADVATITGTNFSDWFNASEGTFVVSALAALGVSTTQYVFSISDGTTNNLAAVYRPSTKLLSSAVISGGATQHDSSSAVTQENSTAATSSLAIEASDSARAYKGNAAQSVTVNTVPTVNQLQFGNRTDLSRPWNGHISKLSFFPQRLINAELQAFSK